MKKYHSRKKKVLLTGGAGFIGHHVVEHLLRKTNWDIVILDKLSYASYGLERLRDGGTLSNPRVKVFPIDITLPITVGVRKEIGEDVNLIIHMAAESHVDNSIQHPRKFFHNNIDGTIEMLEYARTLKDLEMFFYFSTDEVYGSAPDDVAYGEWDRHKPTNPYSASKSAAENICISYENTYKVPLMSINVMNAFGGRQHVEKYIPKTIKNVLYENKVYIHSYPDKKRAGSRFYIHARNIAAAILFLLERGKVGEKYNIVGEKEVDNLELAQFIADVVGKPLNYEMVDFHSDRPGHDLRYSLSGEKMASLGWKLPVNFEDSLRSTIKWTLANPEWLEEK
jgi:dTDP-glucose 4,6-dehydratase